MLFQRTGFVQIFRLFLGSVDASPPPDEGRDEAQHAHVVSGRFFVTQENPAVVLDVVEEAFNQMALFGDEPIDLAYFLVLGAGAVRACARSRF